MPAAETFTMPLYVSLHMGPLSWDWDSCLLPQFKQKLPEVKSKGSHSRRKERNASAEAGGGRREHHISRPTVYEMKQLLCA